MKSRNRLIHARSINVLTALFILCSQLVVPANASEPEGSPSPAASPSPSESLAPTPSPELDPAEPIDVETGTSDGAETDSSTPAVCDVPCTATEVIFDDTYLVGGAPGCGYLGFSVNNLHGNRVQGNPAYTVTGTTVVTASATQTWTGNVDSWGRVVIYYCPPPGVGTRPVEVTFTATVGAASAVAVRIWEPAPAEGSADLVVVAGPGLIASPILAGAGVADGDIDLVPDPRECYITGQYQLDGSVPANGSDGRSSSGAYYEGPDSMAHWAQAESAGVSSTYTSIQAWAQLGATFSLRSLTGKPANTQATVAYQFLGQLEVYEGSVPVCLPLIGCVGEARANAYAEVQGRVGVEQWQGAGLDTIDHRNPAFLNASRDAEGRQALGGKGAQATTLNLVPDDIYTAYTRLDSYARSQSPAASYLNGEAWVDFGAGSGRSAGQQFPKYMRMRYVKIVSDRKLQCGNGL